MTDTALDSVHLISMRIDRVDMERALTLIEGFIQERRPRHVVTADATMVVLASQDAEFASIVAESDLVTPDGAGILWATKRLGNPVGCKVSGVDLAARLCELSVQKEWRIFFFGAAPGVAEEAKTQIQARFPGANIVGVRDGFFTCEEEPAIVEQIREAKPDILLVAMGVPAQEKFIRRNREALSVPVSIGVGGTFDVFSGRVNRAPVWMQNCGIEWVHRVLVNPKKISKVANLPRFVRMVLSTPRRAPRAS